MADTTFRLALISTAIEARYPLGWMDPEQMNSNPRRPVLGAGALTTALPGQILTAFILAVFLYLYIRVQQNSESSPMQAGLHVERINADPTTRRQ